MREDGGALHPITPNALTGMKELYSRVGQVDGNIILQPENGWFRIARSAADHHRVAVLLDRLQCRAFDDPRVAARSCTTSYK